MNFFKTISLVSLLTACSPTKQMIRATNPNGYTITLEDTTGDGNLDTKNIYIKEGTTAYKIVMQEEEVRGEVYLRKAGFWLYIGKRELDSSEIPTAALEHSP